MYLTCRTSSSYVWILSQQQLYPKSTTAAATKISGGQVGENSLVSEPHGAMAAMADSLEGGIGGSEIAARRQIWQG